MTSPPTLAASMRVAIRWSTPTARTTPGHWRTSPARRGSVTAGFHLFPSLGVWGWLPSDSRLFLLRRGRDCPCSREPRRMLSTERHRKRTSTPSRWFARIAPGLQVGAFWWPLSSPSGQNGENGRFLTSKKEKKRKEKKKKKKKEKEKRRRKRKEKEKEKPKMKETNEEGGKILRRVGFRHVVKVRVVFPPFSACGLSWGGKRGKL